MIPCRDHQVAEKGLSQLTSAYSELPNITAITGIFLARSQVLAEAAYDVLNVRLIGVSRVPVPLIDKGCCDDEAPPDLTGAPRVAVILDAQGVHLDPVGKIVDEYRGGLSDAEFLIAIKAKIRANKSDGLAEDILQIARISTPYGTPIFYSQPAPATFYLEIYGFEGAATMARLIGLARMGGVRGVFGYSVAPFSELFRFSSTYGGATGNGPESTRGGTALATFSSIRET